MNSMIGSCNIGYEEVICVTCTRGHEDGKRFADLCAVPELVITKQNWVSTSYTAKNQIDHLCKSRKFRKTRLDVRVMREADASSDHPGG